MYSNYLKPVKINELKEKCHILFLCEKNSEILGGAGIWFKNDFNENLPRLYFNASLVSKQKFQPNNLLYWSCIKWCRQNKYNSFDLGGWQINPYGNLKGVNKFKERWGKVIYYSKEYPFFQAVGRKLIRNSSFFWNINNLIKKRQWKEKS